MDPNHRDRIAFLRVCSGAYEQGMKMRHVRRGKDVRVDNPNIANELGIGMVHQHFKLVHNFTVTENIVLGIEPTTGLVLSLKEASHRNKTLWQQYGLKVQRDARN